MFMRLPTHRFLTTRGLVANTPISRAFFTTPRRQIKEDADRTPEQVEKAKQEQLQEQREGKGRWREDLASHGESSIKADRESTGNIKEMQKETAKKGEKGEI